MATGNKDFIKNSYVQAERNTVKASSITTNNNITAGTSVYSMFDEDQTTYLEFYAANGSPYYPINFDCLSIKNFSSIILHAGIRFTGATASPGNWTVKIETSDDNSSWTERGTQTVTRPGGAGTIYFNITTGDFTDRYIRFKVSQSGGSSDVNYFQIRTAYAYTEAF